MRSSEQGALIMGLAPLKKTLESCLLPLKYEDTTKRGCLHPREGALTRKPILPAP